MKVPEPLNFWKNEGDFLQMLANRSYTLESTDDGNLYVRFLTNEEVEFQHVNELIEELISKIRTKYCK